jgi:anti-sigma B factor antagonist
MPPDPVADVEQARRRMDFELLETAAALDSISTPPEGVQLPVDAGINVEASPQTTVVHLSGDIDVYNSPRVAQDLELLMRSGPMTIVLALENLRFIDSSGLGVLVRAAKQARDAGGQILLRRPMPSIRKVLEITGLDNVFTVID